MRQLLLSIPCFLLIVLATGIAGEAPDKKTPAEQATPQHEDGSGHELVDLRDWPANHRLVLTPPLRNYTRAYFDNDPQRRPILFEIKPDASAITLELPVVDDKAQRSNVWLESVEKTRQFSTGRITLSALDAEVLGPEGATPKAKLESQPGTHRIGFWTKEQDYVRWEYNATRPGMYAVELTYAVAGGNGTEIEIKVGEKTVTGKLTTTGSYYRYTVLDVGNVYIPAAGKLPVTVRCLKKTGGAVMNLKAVTLRPTCEGTRPKADAAGVITCHARDVTIQGTKVQYEPKPEKNTVGFWVNREDQVLWEFDIGKTGKYEIEVVQGCGKYQGGSKVQLKINQQSLEFLVEDTGHFQNFKPRVIGEVELQAGPGKIAVIPLTKAAGAVMDLRQVKLTPK